jgi:hypothetical protein
MNIFWLVLKLEISYRVMAYFAFFKRFYFEDYIFAW